MYPRKQPRQAEQGIDVGRGNLQPLRDLAHHRHQCVEFDGAAGIDIVHIPYRGGGPAMIDGGARAIWLGYIEVDDVDQAVTRLQNAGGRVLMTAADLPGVGRIALVADPQGALFYLMHSLDAQDSLAFAHDLPRPGHCAWNELTTPDAKASLAFYNAQFGWVKDGQMDQGPNGTYEFLRHGYGLGALTPSPAAAPAQWTYYFRVADFDTAVERIGAGGGQIGMGPVTIPDGDRILHAVDPQGARFALIG